METCNIQDRPSLDPLPFLLDEGVLPIPTYAEALR